MLRLTVALPELDAITAGLKLLSRELESQSIAPNDGDVGDLLTCHGHHSGLDAAAVADLCDRISDAPVQQIVDGAKDWSHR